MASKHTKQTKKEKRKKGNRKLLAEGLQAKKVFKVEGAGVWSNAYTGWVRIFWNPDR